MQELDEKKSSPNSHQNRSSVAPVLEQKKFCYVLEPRRIPPKSRGEGLLAPILVIKIPKKVAIKNSIESLRLEDSHPLTIGNCAFEAVILFRDKKINHPARFNPPAK